VKSCLTEVSPGLDLVSPHVDEGAEHHLNDLKRGDGHADGAGDAETQRTQSIVGIHEGVHRVVHHHKPTSGSEMVGVAVPHVDQGADVMVPMQEDQLLFTEHDEQRITKFIHFRYGEHKCPETSRSIEIGRIAH